MTVVLKNASDATPQSSSGTTLFVRKLISIADLDEPDNDPQSQVVSKCFKDVSAQQVCPNKFVV